MSRWEEPAEGKNGRVDRGGRQLLVRRTEGVGEPGEMEVAVFGFVALDKVIETVPAHRAPNGPEGV